MTSGYDRITIDASKNETHIWRNLKDENNLEEEISSTVCMCDQLPSHQLPSSPLTSALGRGLSGRTENVPPVPTELGATEKDTTTITSTTTPAPISKCSFKADWSGNQCATLYQDQYCIGWRHDLSIGYTELTKINRQNDAELVVIRPGCKFVGKLINDHSLKVFNYQIKRMVQDTNTLTGTLSCEAIVSPLTLHLQ